MGKEWKNVTEINCKYTTIGIKCNMHMENPQSIDPLSTRTEDITIESIRFYDVDRISSHVNSTKYTWYKHVKCFIDEVFNELVCNSHEEDEKRPFNAMQVYAEDEDFP